MLTLLLPQTIRTYYSNNYDPWNEVKQYHAWKTSMLYSLMLCGSVQYANYQFQFVCSLKEETDR